jgi:hypothetical protein
VRRALLLTALTLVLVRVIVACIIADPPAEPPTPPVEAPTIVQTGLVPSTLFSLPAWPQQFVVPVTVPQPTTLAWGIFLDFGSAGYSGIFPGGQNAQIVAAAGMTSIVVSVSAPMSPGCHSVSLFVAAVPGATMFEAAYLPISDVANWIYDPTGTGCLGLDGGAFGDGAFPPMQDGLSPIVPDGAE